MRCGSSVEEFESADRKPQHLHTVQRESKQKQQRENKPTMQQPSCDPTLYNGAVGAAQAEIMAYLIRSAGTHHCKDHFIPCDGKGLITTMFEGKLKPPPPPNTGHPLQVSWDRIAQFVWVVFLRKVSQSSIVV